MFEKKLKNGKIIRDRYIIKEFIGKGSYGQVYIAFDRKLKKNIIVKQLRRRKLMSTEGVKSFIREASILKGLNHPSIPKLIEDFQSDGNRFIIMEQMEGKNFEELIFHEKKQFNEQESFHTLLALLDIVKYLHSQGIVHRDLRIPNIMIKDNQLYLIDFGLARKIEDNQLPETDLFPEEKRLMREVSFKSDFYALGHFVLFLLYSTYETDSKIEKSWEDELDLTMIAKKVIRRLLQIDAPYNHVNELIEDVYRIIE